MSCSPAIEVVSLAQLHGAAIQMADFLRRVANNLYSSDFPTDALEDAKRFLDSACEEALIRLICQPIPNPNPTARIKDYIFACGAYTRATSPILDRVCRMDPRLALVLIRCFVQSLSEVREINEQRVIVMEVHSFFAVVADLSA